MKNVIQVLPAVALAVLLTVVTLPFFTTSTLALGSPCVSNCNGNGNVHGAPGPIAGAGLPILAVGYGVYWLIKRHRKSD
jgi:hypothetical protein